MFRLGAVLEEFDLDRNAARRRMRNLSGEQAIVRPGSGADDPQNVALPPLVTPDEPHFRRRVGLDLLEFPLWKIDHHKSAGTVCKIENGLPFCDGRAWAGQNRPDHVISGQQHVGVPDPLKTAPLFSDFRGKLFGDRGLLQHLGFEFLTAECEPIALLLGIGRVARAIGNEDAFLRRIPLDLETLNPGVGHLAAPGVCFLRCKRLGRAELRRVTGFRQFLEARANVPALFIFRYTSGLFRLGFNDLLIEALDCAGSIRTRCGTVNRRRPLQYLRAVASPAPRDLLRQRFVARGPEDVGGPRKALRRDLPSSGGQ